MRSTPRFFPSDLDRRARRVYGAATVFFLVTVVALVWPVYSFFGEIRPFVFGMPFSLFYVVVWLVGSFLVLLGVFVWEGRRERASRRGRGGRRATGRPPERSRPAAGRSPAAGRGSAGRRSDGTADPGTAGES